MLTQIIKRVMRSPLQAVCVVLLAALLATSLCGLHSANLTQQQEYDELCSTVQVELIVTNLSGTRSDGLQGPSWVKNVFTSRLVQNSLKQYVTDVKIKATQDIEKLYINGSEQVLDTQKVLVGLTDLSISGEFSQINSSQITWLGGYDEIVLAGEEPVCIIPESMIPEGCGKEDELEISFEFRFATVDQIILGEYSTETVTLKIVGTIPGDGKYIYCPYEVVEDIYLALDKPAEVDAIRATLVDNSLIGEVREAASNWFAEPNATGTKTPWRYSFYFWYPYALKIDTAQLDEAETTLKISLLINEICTVLVFALSAGASFFIGFLMIRSRKREIALMRTLGTGGVTIFIELALEQLLCLLAGTAIGGCLFGFQPMDRLLLFIAVYFTALCIALVIFLSRNLMTTIKEDE